MTVTPLDMLRSIAYSTSNPILINQVDKWISQYVVQVSCQYTNYDFRDMGGANRAMHEEVLRKRVTNQAFELVKRETVEIWAQPPFEVTTLSIFVIGRGES